MTSVVEILTIVLIALVWALFFGELSLFNLVVGALLGLFLLSVVQRRQERSFPKRLGAVLRFVYRFFVELFVASIVVARLALVPRPTFHPHIIAVPLRVSSDGAIALLSATITLLPGTVAMGVSADRSVLYAHAIGEADVNKARDSVVRIETLILGFMR